MFFSLLLFIVTLSSPVWAQQKGWEKEWNETLSAARKEGKVVVANSPDPAMREISTKFKERFGITVEHIFATSQLAARLKSEQQAGVYTVDVFMGGIQTIATILYRDKMLSPVKPVLILPEVVDGAKWKTGKLWFADPEERYALRVFSRVSGLLHINTSVVKPGELASAKDLLNPKWRGKISTHDPTTSGSGSNTAARIYAQLGEEFVQRLYVDQKPTVTRERRQLSDWLIRGIYPISFGVHPSEMEKLKKEGFPIDEIFEFPDMSPALSGSPWLLTLMDKSPHPNAARIFANWVVGREALGIYSKAEGSSTMRADVDESFLPQDQIPRANVKYFDTFDWEWTVTGKERVRLRMKEIIKR